MNTHTIFLALGSNVGNKEEYIKNALSLLKQNVTNIEVAPIYKTKPWGFTSQDFFLNTAIKGQTLLFPNELLEFTQHIEQKVGRIKRFSNGPREVDIDILFYDKDIIKTKELEVPHSRIVERDFVLRPLVDLDKDFIHPSYNTSVENLYKNLRADSYIISKFESNE